MDVQWTSRARPARGRRGREESLRGPPSPQPLATAKLHGRSCTCVAVGFVICYHCFCDGAIPGFTRGPPESTTGRDEGVFYGRQHRSDPCQATRSRWHRHSPYRPSRLRRLSSRQALHYNGIQQRPHLPAAVHPAGSGAPGRAGRSSIPIYRCCFGSRTPRPPAPKPFLPRSSPWETR